MTGIIIIDKPPAWTSQDVCAKLRGALREKRVGHSGTLDPMATGVLPVFVGRATRAVGFAESDRKRYTACVRFGVTTDTQDMTGTIIETRECDVTEAELLSVLPEFTGEIDQIPPMYSAVKIGGQKLYELARRGKDIERPARRVNIYSIDLIGRERGDFVLDVRCSKGTYIRTLAHDIGKRLGCGGALSGRRRTEAGIFKISDAHPLDEVISAAGNGQIGELLLPTDRLFAACPAVTVDPERERRCRCGNDFPADVPDGDYRVYSESGEFLLLGRARGGRVYTVKNFFSV